MKLNYVDQFRDPWEPLYEQTAESYDTYLEREYETNRMRFAAEWNAHYEQMRTAYEATVLRLLESGKKREGMFTADIGRGPFDHDQRIIDTLVKRYQAVVTIDFATRIRRAAMTALLEGGVSKEKMYEMRFDISSGLSTVYDQYWEEKLGSINTEEELCETMDVLHKADIVMELDARVSDAVAAAARQDTCALAGERTFEEPLNRDRRMILSEGGKRMPLDLVYLPMVIAGTGVPGEKRVWGVYEDTIMSNDSKEGEPSEATLISRRRVLRRIHGIIAAYNTAVAERIFKKILVDNPRATLLAVTDVSTTYDDERLNVGELPRLIVDELIGNLEEEGILVSRNLDVKPWVWKDEPAHHHTVNVLSARLQKPESYEESLRSEGHA